MTLGGWTITTLGEVLPLTYGKALPKVSRTIGTVPVYGSSGIVGAHSTAVTCGPTLIVGRKGNVGEVHLSIRPCWPIDTVYFVEASLSTNLRFFHYLLRFRDLRSLDRSTAVPGLSRDDYDRVEISLPPRPEQQRIVEAIDSFLTRLDNAVASLERVQAKLKAYRASVVKAAVEGRLVPTEVSLARAEKRAYEPAEVLLARILKERGCRWEKAELAKVKAAGKTHKNDNWKAKYEEPMAPNTSKLPELIPGWCWASIEQLMESLNQGWSPQCEKRPASADEWGVMKTTAVQHLAFIADENKAVTADLEPRVNLEVHAGDLLVTRAGPRTRVGVCCLVRATRPRVMLCDKVYRLKMHPGVSAPYVELVLNSPRVLNEIEKLKTGISDSGVNLTQERFQGLAIPLPPRREQDAIELAVGELLSIFDEVGRTVSANLQRCARLRQAILKWAFEGKLVDQDKTDEPADKLLARIRSERAVPTLTKKTRGRPAKGVA